MTSPPPYTPNAHVLRASDVIWSKFSVFVATENEEINPNAEPFLAATVEVVTAYIALVEELSIFPSEPNWTKSQRWSCIRC